jgi:hypothetical protein
LSEEYLANVQKYDSDRNRIDSPGTTAREPLEELPSTEWFGDWLEYVGDDELK